MKKKVVAAIVAAGLVVAALVGAKTGVFTDLAFKYRVSKVEASVSLVGDATSPNDSIEDAASAEGDATSAGGGIYAGNEGIREDSIRVKETTEEYVSILVNPNVMDWMTGIANSFNESNPKVKGKSVSVRIIEVSSGEQIDWLANGKCDADGICPANDLYVGMLARSGRRVEYTSAVTAMDFNGLAVKEDVLKDGMKANDVLNGIEVGDLSFEWDKELTSETSLNLVTYNMCRDNRKSDSEEGIKALAQLKDCKESTSPDVFVDSYKNFTSENRKGYVFVGMGRAISNPLVCVTEDKVKKSVVKEFSKWCTENGSELAIKLGYGIQPEGYEWCSVGISGDDVYNAQEAFVKTNRYENVVVVSDLESSVTKGCITSALGVNKDCNYGVVECTSVDDGVCKALEYSRDLVDDSADTAQSKTRIVVVTDKGFSNPKQIAKFVERQNADVCILGVGIEDPGIKGVFQECNTDDVVYWACQYAGLGIK